MPTEARWPLYPKTSDCQTTAHKAGESRGRVHGKGYENQAVRSEKVYQRGICQYSDATRPRSQSARDAIFWTAFSTYESATMGSHLRPAKPAATSPSSSTELEIA